MGWTLVASTTEVGASPPVTTASINTVGADLIVVLTASSSSPAPVLTDSESNSWTQVLAPGSGGGTGIWYVHNPTTGGSHTFTISTADFTCCTVLAYSGSAASPLDGSSSQGGTTQPGSITPTKNGELLIFSCGLNAAASTFSVNDSFVTENFTDFLTGTNYGLGVATLVQATAAAINPTVTLGSGTPSEVAIVSFIPSSSAVGTINGQATVTAEAGMIGSIAGSAALKAIAGFSAHIFGSAVVSGVSPPPPAPGVTSFPTSNKDPSIMMTLGFTPSQTLLYDNANSENFFVLVLNRSPWSSGFSSGFGPFSGTLYAVSPQFASQWFGSNNGGPPLKTVWNPFPLRTSRLSNLVQP